MMQKLNDWSIRSKAVVILGSLSALVLLLGVLSYSLLSSTNRSTENIGGNWLPSLVEAGKIQSNVGRLRIISGRVAMSENAEALEFGLKLYRDMKANIDKSVEHYGKDLITSPEDRADLEAITRAFAGMLAVDDNTLAQIKAGKHDEALKAYLAGQPAFLETMKAADALVALNQKGADADILSAESNYKTAVLTIILCAAVTLAFSGLSFLVMTRTVSAPIQSITGTMRRLAANELNVEIKEAGRKDEIGEMAAALQVFRDNMVETERLRSEQAAEQEKRVQRSREMERLVAEFDSSVSSVMHAVGEARGTLDVTARSMTQTADSTNSQVTVVAAAAEEASTNVQTVAAAAEELSSSINEIGRQVAEAARFAGQATDQARDTDRQISGLSEAAQRIGDVVQLINDIASQTNLLALNATIEAARAGDAGKGFAVVANEVKTLANQTARATEEISAKVAEMQAATGESVAAVKAIAGTIGRIAEISTGIAAAVDEQNAATGEIARNVQQAAMGTAEVSNGIVQVAQGAAQTGSAAGQVLQAADTLGSNGDTLRRQIDGFLDRVKAV